MKLCTRRNVKVVTRGSKRSSFTASLSFAVELISTLLLFDISGEAGVQGRGADKQTLTDGVCRCQISFDTDLYGIATFLSSAPPSLAVSRLLASLRPMPRCLHFSHEKPS